MTPITPKQRNTFIINNLLSRICSILDKTEEIAIQILLEKNKDIKTPEGLTQRMKDQPAFFLSQAYQISAAKECPSSLPANCDDTKEEVIVERRMNAEIKSFLNQIAKIAGEDSVENTLKLIAEGHNMTTDQVLKKLDLMGEENYTATVEDFRKNIETEASNLADRRRIDFLKKAAEILGVSSPEEALGICKKGFNETEYYVTLEANNLDTQKTVLLPRVQTLADKRAADAKAP